MLHYLQIESENQKSAAIILRTHIKLLSPVLPRAPNITLFIKEPPH